MKRHISFLSLLTVLLVLASGADSISAENFDGYYVGTWQRTSSLSSHSGFCSESSGTVFIWVNGENIRTRTAEGHINSDGDFVINGAATQFSGKIANGVGKARTIFHRDGCNFKYSFKKQAE